MKALSRRIDLTINQPTKLFLEDLENIYSNITGIEDNISIRSDDFEFENIPDLLKNKTTEVTELTIIGYKNSYPNLFLFIYPKTIYLKADNDEPMVLGVIEKIKEIIKSRKRRLLFPAKGIIALSLIGLLGLVLALVLQKLLPDNLILSRIVLAISIFLNLSTWIQLLFAKNQINLVYSKDAPSFWKRNRDVIISGAIMTILTLLITYLLNLFDFAN